MATNNPQVINIANNQVVSLPDAFEVIPIFTEDNISLNQFIEGCKNARNMLPAAVCNQEKSKRSIPYGIPLGCR